MVDLVSDLPGPGARGSVADRVDLAFVYPLTQVLAGLEMGNVLARQRDSLAGLGVAPLARGPEMQGEATEAPYLDRKRIGVAVVEEGSVRAQNAYAGETDEGPIAVKAVGRLEITPGVRLMGKVQRHESYGVFVFLKAGSTGLIPFEETGVERDGDLKKVFPIGSDVEVMVLDVDASARRIRLSRKAILEATEKSEAREYAERQDQAQSEGFGSLADTLRSAMERPKE